MAKAVQQAREFLERHGAGEAYSQADFYLLHAWEVHDFGLMRQDDQVVGQERWREDGFRFIVMGCGIGQITLLASMEYQRPNGKYFASVF